MWEEILVNDLEVENLNLVHLDNWEFSYLKDDYPSDSLTGIELPENVLH
jgi:hypothetical protein